MRGKGQLFPVPKARPAPTLSHAARHHSSSRQIGLGTHHNPSLPFLHKLAVEGLEDVERLLALAAVRDEALAVVEVLYARQRSARRAEVRQNPRRHPAQGRYLLQHPDLMLVDVTLILLRPALRLVAVAARQGVAAELTDDERL